MQDKMANGMLGTMKNLVRTFLARPDSACFIGYEASPLGGTRPVCIRSAAEVDRLVLGRQCYFNLVSYLPHMGREEGTVGLVVKGCDARALCELGRARQVDRSRLYVIGWPCTGLDGPGKGALADRCFGCRYPEHFDYDDRLGPMISPNLPQRSAPPDPAGLTPQEKRRFWEAELDKCIRCDACRKICYGCYCPECIFDISDPRWSSRHHDRRDKFFFHATRALHLAGRCIGCGECERACPAGVRLMLLNRSLELGLEELFDYEGVGMRESTKPPMVTFSGEDPDPADVRST